MKYIFRVIEVIKMFELCKKLLILVIVSVFMISVVAATAYAVNPHTEKNVEYKEKKVLTLKIKWDANGGVVNSKKTVTTTVKKGAKIKLPKTPKMTGYTFQVGIAKKLLAPR